MLTTVHRRKFPIYYCSVSPFGCRRFTLPIPPNSNAPKPPPSFPKLSDPNHFPVVGKVKEFFRQHGLFGVGCYFAIYGAGLAFYYSVCILIPDEYFATLLSYVDFGLTTQYEQNLLYFGTACLLNELSEPLRIGLTLFLVRLRAKRMTVDGKKIGEAELQDKNKE